MLTTNLIKKDILKGSEFEAGLALGGLSCFMTPDLALDLTDDIISLMSSTRPYVRTSFYLKAQIWFWIKFCTFSRSVLATIWFLYHEKHARTQIQLFFKDINQTWALSFNFENWEKKTSSFSHLQAISPLSRGTSVGTTPIARQTYR